jgi:hypothetical protein
MPSAMRRSSAGAVELDAEKAAVELVGAKRGELDGEGKMARFELEAEYPGGEKAIAIPIILRRDRAVENGNDSGIAMATPESRRDECAFKNTGEWMRGSAWETL